MPVQPFVDVRLPDDVEKGASGGPQFNTGITELSSGFERRNANWAQTRGKWDIGYGIQYKDEYELVIAFFYARMGRLVGFRFRDWTDYEIEGQVLATGVADDDRLTFQLFKRYSSGGFNFDRIIRKPVAGTYTFYKNGVAMTEGPGASQFQLDVNTGIITLGQPLVENDLLTFTTEFDVPVRFDTDQLNITAETFEAGEMPSIPVIELKQL